MANNNENTDREQPPKINLNGTETSGPAKAPPPARPYIPSKIRMDADAAKKETAHIDLSSARPIPKGVAPHDKDHLKGKTGRIDWPPSITPISDEERKEAAKKSTIRIDTSEIVPVREDDKNEAAKKSTVRVQIDEDHAKGDTARLEAKSPITEVDEAAKKRTARIDLNEVLEESDDIFKRRTARMEAGKTAGVTEAPGVPRTVRVKRPETPPIPAPRKATPVAEEGSPVATAAIKSETSRKSETARIDLPPEITEQPPTRRKTIRIKRPEGIVTSRPLVISGTKSVAEPGVTAPKEEEAGALFSVMTLVAILIDIALITVQSLTLRSFLQF